MVRKQIFQGLMAATLFCAATTIAGCASGNHAVNMQSSDNGQPQPVQNITVMQAKDLLDSDREHIFLDVRTVEEFEAGHPAGTLNIPVFIKDAATGKKIKNTKFLDIVLVNVPKYANVIIGCRSGKRSIIAANMMHAVGYLHISNMLGGFSGSHNLNGEVVHPGWQSQNYPTEKGLGGDRGYDALRHKSGT